MTDTRTEQLPPPSGEASVVLDIGGSRGALVVFASAHLEGAEIEIRRAGRDWDGTHTAIRRRDLREAVAFAGVFGTLPCGEYDLRLRGTGTDTAVRRAGLRLTVVGGEVTQADWPAPDGGPVRPG